MTCIQKEDMKNEPANSFKHKVSKNKLLSNWKQNKQFEIKLKKF